LFPEYSTDISGDTRFYGGNITLSGLTENSSGTEILVLNNSNVIETISLSSITTPNYGQVTGEIITLGASASEQIITGVTITTNGNPVMVSAYGDAKNTDNSYFAKLQLYRENTPIGSIINTPEVLANEKTPFSLSFIDNPSAGTYTYYL
jgi:hypothetical protein